jgi:hypothetical protein
MREVLLHISEYATLPANLCPFSWRLRCQQDLAVFVREVFSALSRRIRHLVCRPYPGLSRTLHGHVHGRVFTSEVYAAFRTGNVRIQGGDLAGCIVSPRS